MMMMMMMIKFTFVVFLVHDGGSGGDYYNNCAKCDTSMKLGADRQFDTLKKIGCGHKLKNAPLCYF